MHSRNDIYYNIYSCPGVMLIDCDDGLEFWVNFYSLSHFCNRLVPILSAQLNSDIMDFLNKA